jgi:hypothetical protein
MFGSRRDQDSSVTCIACGSSVARTEAREYDKYGDRWERSGKEFEYLCKPCYRQLCHQPRESLEELLVDLGAGETDQDSFLQYYADAVDDRHDAVEE